MNVTPLTPAEAAAFAFRLTGGKTTPELVAAQYRSNAETMREYARKAAASKSGKYCHYTAEQATRHAEEAEARAESVAAELRKLLAA